MTGANKVFEDDAGEYDALLFKVDLKRDEMRFYHLQLLSSWSPPEIWRAIRGGTTLGLLGIACHCQDEKRTWPFTLILYVSDFTCSHTISMFGMCIRKPGCFSKQKVADEPDPLVGLRLVYETNKDLFVLFTRWGEIGETGMFQRTPAANKEEGMKDFCKVFKESQLNLYAFYLCTFSLVCQISWKPKRSYHHIIFFVITHGCAFNLWVKRQYEGDACVGVQLNPKGVPSAQNYQNMLQDSFGEKCLVHDLTASYQRWVALLFVCWCDRASEKMADVFTTEVFSTTNLLHQVPFTRDTFHTKQPLYQKLFVPNVKPEGFYT